MSRQRPTYTPDLWKKSGAEIWAKDLCEYYNVTPEQAYKIAQGYDCNMPASVSTNAVYGGIGEIWKNKSRNKIEKVFEFWKEIGSYLSFRQTFMGYGNQYNFLKSRIKENHSICEYGSGVAPVCFWLIHNVIIPLELTIVDIPSEHLEFGYWRLNKHKSNNIQIKKIEVLQNSLPLTENYNVIIIKDVLEHTHNPLEIVKHTCQHLLPQGLLMETYIGGRISATKPTEEESENLYQSQVERPHVFNFLRNNFTLISGSEINGGDHRYWKKN